MDEPIARPSTRSLVLAAVLWLITFGLALNAIYALKEIFYLVSVRLGGSMEQALASAFGLVWCLGFVGLVVMIGTTEYHFKHVGQPKSWRLFAWTLAVEISILLLYYIL
jgi:hypothetical protein